MVRLLPPRLRVPLNRRAIHAFLARHMYHRRCKVDPLWNSVLVAGFHKGEGYVF